MIPIPSRVLAFGAALCLVTTSSAATVAAQSPAEPLVAKRDERATWPPSLNIVRAYRDETELSTPPPIATPANVVMAEGYREIVELMLRSSATFRRQCGRIAGDRTLHVEIERSLLAGMDSRAARTRITRRSDRGLSATVEIGYLGDPIVLIAHEFEHILEQLDGVDLFSMAARPATGVHVVSGSGHFETDRAIAAGERVSREVHESGRRPGV